MTLRETITSALRQLNPMRLRRETTDKQLEALRKLAKDRLVAANAQSDLIAELREELTQLSHKYRVQTNRLVALKSLLVKLGNDDIDHTPPQSRH
jgi:hypothetical protein